MVRNALTALPVIAIVAGTAHAEMRFFEWNRPDTTVGYTDDAGVLMRAATSYNTATQDLTWDIAYDDTMTEGMTLVLTSNEYPADAGRFAVLFVDWSNLSDIRANVWAHNGSDLPESSIFDGTDHIADAQAGDRVLTSEGAENSWWGGATVSDVGGKRSVSISLNTTLINQHDPAYDGRFGPVEWQGMGYGDEVGIWMRSYAGGLVTDYDSDGYLRDWFAPLGGFFDGVDIITVPTPGTAALFACGLGLAARRRRA